MTTGEARRDRLRKIAHRVRAIPGHRFGLRPHTVALVAGTWSGTHTGDGGVSDDETPIVEANSQPPKVRWLSDEQIAVGSLAKGTIVVGPVTPSFSGGGTDLASIVGTDLSQGDTLHLKVTGPKHPTGALYRISKINADKALRYMITAEPVSETL